MPSIILEAKPLACTSSRESASRWNTIKFVISFFYAVVVLMPTSAEENTADEITQLRQKLEASEAWNSLQVSIVELQKSPADGFYTAILSNDEIAYIHESGQYLFSDVLLLLTEDEVVRYTHLVRQKQELVKRQERKEILNKVELASIDFVPPKGTQHIAYVFTDITCGYCIQLHNEMPGYHEKGIEIRYLLWARAGQDSKPHKDMESAWCSKNPQAALTRLKQGKKILSASCSNSLNDTYAIASRFNIQGTPAIILENGTLIGGYVEPSQLSEFIRRSSN